MNSIVKKTFFLVLIFSWSTLSIAQDAPVQNPTLPIIIPPSPTVANLMHFEEVPIDYYTGQPDINVPIFSKKIHKNLNFNLALRYSTLGLKVKERSGWTGTGWSLEIGGVVSRTVRGFPDESASWETLGVFNNDDFWNYRELSVEEKDEFNWNALGTRAKRNDTDLDLYQFTLFGESGRFVVIKNKENGQLEAKLLSINQHLKIDLSYGSINYNDDPSTPDYDESENIIPGTEYYIDSFTITDSEGYKYFFTQKEETHSSSVTLITTQGNPEGFESPAKNMHYRSAWHLTTVTTSNNQNILSINYAADGSNHQTRTTTTNEIINAKRDGFDVIYMNGLKSNKYNNGILKPRETHHMLDILNESWKPESVSFRDGTSLLFEVEANEHPEHAGNILKSVIIIDREDEEKKRFFFNYEIIKDRLYLTETIESTENVDLHYGYSYFDPSALTSANWSEASGWPSTDFWGYNSSPFKKAGVLNSITYPTGGRKVFEFEEHTYSYLGDKKLTLDELAANEDNISEESHSFHFSDENYDPFSISDRILRETTLTFTHNQTASIRVDASGIRSENNGEGFEDASGSIEFFDNTWLHIKNSNDQIISSARLSDEFVSIDIPKGNDLKVTLETIQEGEYTLNGIVVLRYEELTSNSSEFIQYLKGGGLRIKEISFYDQPLDEMPSSKTIYDYSMPGDDNISSGAVDVLGPIKNDYILEVTKTLFDGPDNIDYPFEPTTVTYRINSENPNVALSKGSYVGYQYVASRKEGLGYTQYRYSNPRTDPSNINSHVYPFPPQPNLDFKRGLLKASKIFDEDGNKLQETINEYTYESKKIAPFIRVVDPENCARKQFYDGYTQYKNANPELDFLPIGIGDRPMDVGRGTCGTSLSVHVYGYQNDEYDLSAGWAKLVERTNTSYYYNEAGQQSTQTISETFDYNEVNHLVNDASRIWQENGEDHSSRTITYFPVGTITIDTDQKELMLEKNFINLPLMTEYYKDSQLISTTRNVFDEVNIGHLELREVKVAKGDNPLESRIFFHRYDRLGNILEVSKSGNSNHTAYLWAYNNTHPVAKVENATYSELASIINNENLDTPPGNDPNLEEELKKLRDKQLDESTLELKHALIYRYFYTSDFLIKKEIDPNDHHMKYNYDPMGRLLHVIDNNNHVLTENEYQYKNQN